MRATDRAIRAYGKRRFIYVPLLANGDVRRLHPDNPVAARLPSLYWAVAALWAKIFNKAAANTGEVSVCNTCGRGLVSLRAVKTSSR